MSDGAENETDLNMEMDRNFLNWLKTQRHSIILSSYKTGCIYSLGYTTFKSDQLQTEQLSFWSTSEIRCMGISTTNNGKDIWIASKNRLTKYGHHGTEKEETEKFVRSPFDGIYIPRTIHFTGDIDVHDIVIPTGSAKPYFVNALHSCVCVPSDTSSFKVYWKPPWISKIAAEDRTHLNGLCCDSTGKTPKYVTATAMTDIRGGWRAQQRDGGVLYDIIENRIVCKNLSMPHSPRMNGGDATKVWVLNSGHGEFGYVDLSITQDDGTHPFIAKCFIPAYLRGLTFIGNEFAIIGGSDDRHDNVFSNLPLGDILKSKGNIKARCGIFVVNLTTFDIVHEFTFTKGVKELYDVVTIPHIIRPKIYESFAHDAIEGLITIEGSD